MSDGTTKTDEKNISLEVAEAPAGDTGRGIARIDPQDMERIGAVIGDVIRLDGKRTTFAKVMRTYTTERGKGVIQVDDLVRINAKSGLGESVSVSKATYVLGKEVALSALTTFSDPAGKTTEELSRHLQGMVVDKGDKTRLERGDLPSIDFIVGSTDPEGPVVVGTDTAVKVKAGDKTKDGQKVSYLDVGGLGAQLQQVREVMELPLKHPEVFTQLGIEPPKGVLLYGPPGTGKTLTARAVAGETSAHFVYVSGPEVFHKFYGESEAHLREVFREAQENAPSIIFLDEIDSIAAKREDVYGEVEKRVVAQLMALMDGLEARGQVMVIAATNIPGSLDPALRRPGRFDREIHISIPDYKGRMEILKIHTRTMPMAPDVDLGAVSNLTYGYVGADLANLCREAAMIRLRKEMQTVDFDTNQLTPEKLKGLMVHRDDFMEAIKGLKPSAIRELATDVDKVKWEDVGGLEEAKQALRETIEWPMKYATLFKHANAKPARGILLSGPPGTGKTLLARAVASESGTNFISIKGSQLLSKWVGESEKDVRELFKKARMTAPCIMFFDEIDALAPHRGSGGDSQVTERMVSALLAEIDGVEELGGVILLGATNRLDMVDPALLAPGRFDQIIQLPLPDVKARLEILKVHTRNKTLASDVNLDTLADLTNDYSGGDIAFICRRATMLAIREYVDQGGEMGDYSKFSIGARHFRKAMEEVRRPVMHQHAAAEAPAAATPTPSGTTTPAPAASEKSQAVEKPRQRRQPSRPRPQVAKA